MHVLEQGSHSVLEFQDVLEKSWNLKLVEMSWNSPGILKMSWKSPGKLVRSEVQ